MEILWCLPLEYFKVTIWCREMLWSSLLVLMADVCWICLVWSIWGRWFSLPVRGNPQSQTEREEHLQHRLLHTSSLWWNVVRRCIFEDFFNTLAEADSQSQWMNRHHVSCRGMKKEGADFYWWLKQQQWILISNTKEIDLPDDLSSVEVNEYLK